MAALLREHLLPYPSLGIVACDLNKNLGVFLTHALQPLSASQSRNKKGGGYTNQFSPLTTMCRADDDSVELHVDTPPPINQTSLRCPAPPDQNSGLNEPRQ